MGGGSDSFFDESLDIVWVLLFLKEKKFEGWFFLLLLLFFWLGFVGFIIFFLEGWVVGLGVGVVGCFFVSVWGIKVLFVFLMLVCWGGGSKVNRLFFFWNKYNFVVIVIIVF